MVSISYPETKDQWARDDPAFLVLLSIWLCGKVAFVAQSLWLQIVHYLSKFDTLTQEYFWLPCSRAATKISICLVRWIYSQ